MAPVIDEIPVLWLTAGLSCDGDTIAMTAATQPSLEDLVLGAIPGVPRVRLHHPVLAYEVGDEFLAAFEAAASGELDPFILVVEGSIPDESNNTEGASGPASAPIPRPGSRSPRPPGSTGWSPGRGPSSPSAPAPPTAASTPWPATPPGPWGWPTTWAGTGARPAGLPIVNVPGCPVHPDNCTETLLYLLRQAAGTAPPIPLDHVSGPKWLFAQTLHESCDRAGYYEQGDFAGEYGSPKCIVKLGCWGPVVDCNVGKRGWINGIGGCANVGGTCIGCTMPGFPDKFQPFLDEPPGAKMSTSAVLLYGRTVRALRNVTRASMNVEPEWRGPAGRHRRQSRRRRTTPHDGSRHRPTVDATPSATSSTCRGTRSPASSAASASTPGSTSATARSCAATSTSSIFRGYSVFMKGKDPRDAHVITSRICGICGDNHATSAVYAQHMAFGVQPPHLAEWIINLAEAAEYMFDHNLYQENLVGVDFCERMVRETNPSVLALAERTEAPHAGVHGYRTIADIMRAFNPFEGDLYREALHMSRVTREMFCLMEGRHVHPSTLYPGGVGTVPSVQLFNEYLVRLMKYIEFLKRMVPLHDDLFDFFYEALPGYEEVGPAAGPARLLGCVPGPRDLRLQVRPHDRLGSRTCSSRPGVVVDGELVTTDLVEINLGMRILLGSSFYDDWQDGETFVTHDPLGNPVDQRHPWNQTTIPRPQQRDLDGGVHLGDVAPVARRPAPASSWPSTPAAAPWPGCGSPPSPAGSTRRSSRPPAAR